MVFVLAVVLSLLLTPSAVAGSTTEPDPAQPDATADAPSLVPPEGQATFGIGPATADAADERPFLAYTVPPLGSVYDSVAMINYSLFPLDLALYAADATQGEDGSVGFADRSSQRDAAWVTFGTPEEPVDGLVTVPGRDDEGQPGRVVVPFQIAVPENGSPGDHVIGLVASLTTLGENPGSQNIELEQRVATRVFLRVDGDVVSAVDVLDVQTDYTKGSVPWRSGTSDVTYTIANAGNLRAGVNPSVVVSGPFGLLERTVELDPIVDLLPGSSQSVTSQVPGVWPLVRLAVTAEAEVVAPPNGEDPGIGTTRFSVGLWAVSLELIIAAAVLLMLGALLIARAVRRRRQRRAIRSLAVTPATTEEHQPVG